MNHRTSADDIGRCLDGTTRSFIMAELTTHEARVLSRRFLGRSADDTCDDDLPIDGMPPPEGGGSSGGTPAPMTVVVPGGRTATSPSPRDVVRPKVRG